MNGTRLKRGIASALLSMALLAGLPAQANQAAGEAQKWLENMAAASRQLTYRGHFVYQQGASLETLSVAHTMKNGQELERIAYLDGIPKEMIRQGNEIVFSSANRPSTRFQHESLVPMVGRFTSLPFSKNYQLRPAAIDRIAGRAAVQLLVVPTDRFRYGYQLWLDRKTSLLLKSVMLDSEGKIIERVQFTNLEPDVALTDKELKAMSPAPSGKASETLVKMSGSVSKPDQNWGWEAGWIPAGFEVQSQSRRVSPVSDRMVDTVIYSDGLANFSVFVEPDETRVLSQAAEQIGSMAAVSKVFRNDNDYFHVTVVGEVPLGTAERIAVSVRPEINKKKAEEK